MNFWLVRPAFLPVGWRCQRARRRRGFPESADRCQRACRRRGLPEGVDRCQCARRRRGLPEGVDRCQCARRRRPEKKIIQINTPFQEVQPKPSW